MHPIEKIDQAFLQFSFSLKSLCYFELNKVEKDDFDTEINFLEDSINLPAGEFNRYEDLILGAENNVMVCLGFTAMVIEESFLYINRLLLDDNENNIIDLLYMIRCAFAHNPIEPEWCIKSKYRKFIRVILSDSTIDIDLRNKNGTSFDIKDIGGYSNYYRLKDEVKRLLENKRILINERRWLKNVFCPLF